MHLTIMKNLKIVKNIFIRLLNNENNLLYKVINFIILFIVLFVIIFFQPIDRIAVKENEVLKKSIIAKKDIKYYDEVATKRNEEIIKLTTPPIFIFNKDYIKFQQEKIKNLFDKIMFSESFESIKKNISDDKIIFNSEDYQLFKNLIVRNKSFINIFLSVFNKISSTKIIESSSFLNKFDGNAIKISEFENNKFKYTIYYYEEIDTEISIIDKIEKEVENKTLVKQYAQLDAERVKIDKMMKEYESLYQSQSEVTLDTNKNYYLYFFICL